MIPKAPNTSLNHHWSAFSGSGLCLSKSHDSVRFWVNTDKILQMGTVFTLCNLSDILNQNAMSKPPK